MAEISVNLQFLPRNCSAILAYRSIKHIMELKQKTNYRFQGSCSCLSVAAVALYNNFLLFISIFFLKVWYVITDFCFCIGLGSQILDLLLLQILSINNYFAVHLQPFYNLKSLELHTSFNKNNVLGIACLFRNSPTLHTLILKIINDYNMERRVSFTH